MTTARADIEWYLARDGRQYGPLSDVEMKKFVELGHLKPTDLVWRQGFPDWRPATSVFPEPAPAPAVPPRPEKIHPAPDRDFGQRHRSESGHRLDARERVEPKRPRTSSSRTLPAEPEPPLSDHLSDDDFEPRSTPSRRRRRLAVALGLILVLGGGGWYAAAHLDDLPLPSMLLWSVSDGAELTPPPLEALRASPFQGIADTEQATDQAWQQAALWQTLKENFPEWYQERLKEAVQLKAEGKTDADIVKTLASGIVTLRRRYAKEALAASPAALRALASTFVANLKHLTEHNVEACYSFISQGEANPQILELMKNPDHLQHLQLQVTSVFEAVSEGRRSPQTHLPPRRSDYDALTQALKKRGWSDADLQLFSDPKQLARAKPEVVCRMVQDWFAAQLGIRDRGVQVRLLVESLRPVVAG